MCIQSDHLEIKRLYGIAVAAHASHLAAMANLRLPTQTHPLQAYVPKPIKPILNCVVMFNAVHVHLSQTDKGEFVMGAGIDKYIGYKMNGSFSIIEDQLAACMQLFPLFSKLKVMRTWTGLIDISDNRVCFTLRGPHSQAILQSGTAINIPLLNTNR